MKVGAAIFAGPGSLPLDSLCDLEQITSPGFMMGLIVRCLYTPVTTGDSQSWVLCPSSQRAFINVGSSFHPVALKSECLVENLRG